MAQDQPAEQGLDARSDVSPVVAFDFDGTLTVRDSFTAFLKWRSGPLRYATGLARLFPSAVAYVFHRDRGRIKAAAVREYLRGVPRHQLEAEASAYAERFSRSLLRPDAMAAWRRWRNDEVRLVIVTASPELLIAPFARDLGADVLLGTGLAFDAEGRITGALSTPNCRGLEKVVRLRAAFGPAFELEAAYGDTSGDREMLALAKAPGFRIFRGKP